MQKLNRRQRRQAEHRRVIQQHHEAERMKATSVVAALDQPPPPKISEATQAALMERILDAREEGDYETAALALAQLLKTTT